MYLYVSEPKARISIKGQTLVVTTESEVKKLPLGWIESLCLHKSVQITSQAICSLSEEGINVSWLSSDRIICQTFGAGNVLRQKQQFDVLHDTDLILNLSKKNLCAKIKNQMKLVQRPELFRKQDIEKCTSVQMLLGVEGSYASVYFTELARMLPAQYHFTGRKKHPATDPVNSVLSFVYTLLYNNITSVLAIHGLNPSVGFCHTLRNGHYALSSDLMESLRCELCDTLMLNLFQTEPDMQQFTETESGIRILRFR